MWNLKKVLIKDSIEIPYGGAVRAMPSRETII